MRSFLCSAIFLAYASASFTYDETEMLCLVNKERTQRGLSALGRDSRLAAAAQSHSNDQARRRKMTHDGADGSTPGQRIDRQNYNWVAVAENVAYGYDDEVQCMDAWMNSPGHRANILSPKYVEMGSAVAFSGDVPYYTQDFGNTGKPPKNIPNCGGGNGNDVVKRRRGDRKSKEEDRRRQDDNQRNDSNQDDNQDNNQDSNQDDNQDSNQDDDRRRQEEEDKQKQDDDRRRQEEEDRKKQEDDDRKKKEDEDKKQQNGNNGKHNRGRRRGYTKKPRWFQDQFANKPRKPQGQLHKECRMVDEAGFTFPLDYGKAKETTKKGGCGK